MFVRDSGKWATVLAEGQSGAVASGLCNVQYLNQLAKGFVKQGSKCTR